METTLIPGTPIRTLDGKIATVASGLNQARAPRGTIAVTRNDLPLGGLVFLPVSQISGVHDPQATPAPADHDQEWNRDLIDLAIDHERAVTFNYKKLNGHTEFRVVTPHDVVETRAGDMLIVGHDEDKDDTRSYRLDRIVGTVIA